MTSSRTMATPGLGGQVEKVVETDLTGGVPKPVKKTFAEPMSKAELDQRKKGSSVGVNVPGGPAAINAQKQQQDAQQAQPQSGSQSSAKPGDIGAFKGWVKDL